MQDEAETKPNAHSSLPALNSALSTLNSAALLNSTALPNCPGHAHLFDPSLKNQQHLH
jgi:hypothetical protein